MNVSELIFWLSKEDPDTEVFVQDGEGFVHSFDDAFHGHAVETNDWYGLRVIGEEEYNEYLPEELIKVYILLAEGA